MEEAPIPVIETKKPDNIEEKNLFDFSLLFNEKSYKCSLKEIEESNIKIIVSPSNCSFKIYEGEFTLYDFQNLNRNFRIYDNIKELENDLIGYIEQNKIKISEIQDNKLKLELTIIAKLDNIITIILNRSKVSLNINIEDIFYEELEKKNKEIASLKEKLKEIEQKRNEDLELKNKKIFELEKRLEKIETSSEYNKTSDNTSFKNNKYKINNIEKLIKIINIKDLKKEFKTIKTKKPVNEICLFPESGNYIESSGPKIFDKYHNLIKSFDEIGFCEHICIIKENFLILTQKNIFILLRIINAKENIYKYNTFKNTLKNETIKKIIKGFNQDEIITSDVNGNIGFWKIELANNELKLKMSNSIDMNYNSNTYVFLFKHILIIGAEQLYLYNIRNDINNGINLKNRSTFNIKPLCWNAMISINEDKNIIGVGCENIAYILQIDDINEIFIIKKIKIFNECHTFDSLCLYFNTFLLLGERKGNIYFYDINNFELIKKIENAHQIDKDSNASINGIVELSDGAFTSFGEDRKIKIWYI